MNVKDYRNEIKLLASDVLILAIDGHLSANAVLDDLRDECANRLAILEGVK